MKYLILGVNGMAGHMIAQYLKEQNHEVTGFARKESVICRTITGDACKWQDILRAVTSDDYDVVVNCIGVLNKAVDRALADGIYLNSVLPHFLAEKLENTKSKLIHISTDCVFEGTKGKYTETDIPDASSYYGRSKALGEVNDDRNLTIRTSIVGPELKQDGIGLFHWFMLQKKWVEGYTNVIWSGVTTLQLAKAIEADGKKNQKGLYHLVNNEEISKYALLELFNQYCRKKKIEIKENCSIVNNKSLVNTQQRIFEVPSYEKMVNEMEEWIQKHPLIYQQYKAIW